MLNCVFFGHRDCPEEIMGLLRKTVLDLLKEDRCCFMVGNNGRFDRMVRQNLQEKHGVKRKGSSILLMKKTGSEQVFFSIYGAERHSICFLKLDIAPKALRYKSPEGNFLRGF